MPEEQLQFYNLLSCLLRTFTVPDKCRAFGKWVTWCLLYSGASSACCANLYFSTILIKIYICVVQKCTPIICTAYLTSFHCLYSLILACWSLSPAVNGWEPGYALGMLPVHQRAICLTFRVELLRVPLCYSGIQRHYNFNLLPLFCCVCIAHMLIFGLWKVTCVFCDPTRIEPLLKT